MTGDYARFEAERQRLKAKQQELQAMQKQLFASVSGISETIDSLGTFDREDWFRRLLKSLSPAATQDLKKVLDETPAAPGSLRRRH